MQSEEQMRLDIDVDLNRLDEQWVGQVRLRRHYGRLLADARRDLADAKAELKLVEAELKLAIRTKPDEFDLDKVTESAIEATVVVQPRYKAAQRRVIECQHEVDVLDESAVAAIDHRKKALEDLVQLYLSGYFAAPRAPEGAKESMADREQREAFRRGSGKGRGRPADREPETKGKTAADSWD